MFLRTGLENGDLHWHYWLDRSSSLSYTALAGLSSVFFECYVLCALVVLFQSEIFDKHIIVLLAASITTMKSEQIPQSTKE